MYNLDSRLIDIISADPTVILLLPRFGIGLGFGNSTVKQVCRDNNVPATLFLMVCNIYAVDGYRVSREHLSGLELGHLLRYLRGSHQYYLSDRLPHIRSHLDSVAQSAGDVQGHILTRYYNEYIEQVESHFKNEEQKLFPTVERLAAGQQADNSVIESFARHHDRLDEQLSDLMQLVLRYMPGADTKDSSEMLFDIVILVRDLQKHAQIEEKVLLPYIKLLM